VGQKNKRTWVDKQPFNPPMAGMNMNPMGMQFPNPNMLRLAAMRGRGRAIRGRGMMGRGGKARGWVPGVSPFPQQMMTPELSFAMMPVPGVAPHFNPAFFRDPAEDMYHHGGGGYYDRGHSPHERDSPHGDHERDREGDKDRERDRYRRRSKERSHREEGGSGRKRDREESEKYGREKERKKAHTTSGSSSSSSSSKSRSSSKSTRS